ncbi:hypothetical protein HHK36_029837 [Tetracentron sinense]|uniref:Pentatricopeptide repeat-containing protein n=1 Tax=Tetracentron sinense TaxID=13715 RepID=A0A834YFZ5_TETSI|nr:hypothetical protein HHK36_029837 [Tetracentron sinense]
MKIQNPKSLLSLIENCTSLQELKQIHAKSIIFGLAYGQFILNKIITESLLSEEVLDYATRIFDRTHEPGIFIWNAMIKGYSSSETPIIAISVYNKMWVSKDVVADNYTFPFVFRACAKISASDKGREVHGVVLRKGYDSDRFVLSSLLNFYTVFGLTKDARKIFDEAEWKDVVFWNAMIMGYTRAGQVLKAFEIFKEMMELRNMKPNEGTMLGLISGCLVTKNLKLGREIHGYVRKEMDFTISVKLGSALIDLYAKCGNLDNARKVFEEMPEKNTVVWNSLICGYSQTGTPRQAIDLFREMHFMNVKPDRFTISGLLSACAQMGAFNLGNWVRQFAEKNRIWDAFVGTSLVDMYAKCGYIEMAREVFDGMPLRTVATWNAILSGYASHGQAKCTIDLFNEMENLGAKPDAVTFLAILHACAHMGLVEEGSWYFDLMVNYYRIAPKVEHYGCMVDLLSRAGFLREARQLIESMGIEPNVIVWGALLNACSIHGDTVIGEWAAHHIFELDPTDGGSYVLLANVYAAARRFDGVKAVRERMVENGIWKPPGCSMIEIGDVVHEFVVADKAHSKSDEIYLVLDELSKRLKMEGYVSMLDVDQENAGFRECSLFSLFTAPNNATFSKEHIFSSLTEVEKTIIQVQEVGSGVLDYLQLVLQVVIDLLKPTADVALPILQKAGDQALKITSPAISEASKKTQEVLAQE